MSSHCILRLLQSWLTIQKRFLVNNISVFLSRNWIRCELGTPKFPDLPFLKPNTLTKSFEILKFFLHGNKLQTASLSSNVAISFFQKAPLQVFNLTFHYLLEFKKCSKYHYMFLLISLLDLTIWRLEH